MIQAWALFKDLPLQAEAASQSPPGLALSAWGQSPAGRPRACQAQDGQSHIYLHSFPDFPLLRMLRENTLLCTFLGHLLEKM